MSWRRGERGGKRAVKLWHLRSNSPASKILLARIVVGPLRTNCYFLADAESKKAVVIDPGAEAGKISSRLLALFLEPSYLLLTHGHADHVTAVPELKEAFLKTRVAGHKADAFMLENDQDSFGASLGLCHPPLVLDKALTGGRRLQVTRNLALTTLHTPGHSPGSVCFYLKEGPFLFSGDTLFHGAVGRTDIAGGDDDTLIKSIKGKLFTLPDETIVYPGHGRPTTIGKERERILRFSAPA